MNFFGNFGGFGRPSWSPLNRNMGGGNPPVGFFGSHVSTTPVPPPNFTSTPFNTRIEIPNPMIPSATALIDSLYPKVEFGASITPP
ncbi:MAG: hypothetical protein LBI47_01045, partial [Puniceicoccales bacterium]|nr:hypothetical protein [Puniceicoccales bacterium]